VRVLYGVLKHIVVGPPATVLCRRQTKGKEFLPPDGPVILASNHQSFSDSVFLPLSVKRHITFLAKSEYFTSPGIKGRLMAGFFRGVGQVPVDRSGGRAADAAIRAGLDVLARGEILGIYPEGTRSPDGRLYRGRVGVARLALDSGAPVIPVAITGTDVVQPPGSMVPRPHKVIVQFGEPLTYPAPPGSEATALDLRTFTDRVMSAIKAMSGQETADMYASTYKSYLARRARAEQAGLPLPPQPGGDAAAFGELVDPEVSATNEVDEE
jgi:1-acyl-sn-glycerol-3-phosphate acyltransferase